jgi:hypothetical protein
MNSGGLNLVQVGQERTELARARARATVSYQSPRRFENLAKTPLTICLGYWQMQISRRTSISSHHAVLDGERRQAELRRT